jgi:hypothetical protein
MENLRDSFGGVCESTNKYHDATAGSAVSISSKVRHDRTQCKLSTSNPTNWRHVCDNQCNKHNNNRGHYGKFISDTNDHKQIRSTKHSLVIESIKPPHQHIMPHLAVNILFSTMTPKDAQRVVDYGNNKIFKYDDPHYCSPCEPCRNIALRMHEVDGKMVRDFRSGSHWVLIDASKLLHSHSYYHNPNEKYPPVIIPSWHQELINKWWDIYKHDGFGDDTLTFPLELFDLALARDIGIAKHIAKFVDIAAPDERVYIVANIFPGDVPDVSTHKHVPLNIQFLRGKIDNVDIIKADIDSKKKTLTYKDAYNIVYNACIRETNEETDGVFRPPDDVTFGEPDSDMVVYADCQYYYVRHTGVNEKITRGVTIGPKTPVNLYRWIDSHTLNEPQRTK